MKLATIFITTALAIGFISCEQSTDSKDTPRAVKYDVYDRYYYIGPRPLGDSTMYYWTTTKDQFDSVFIMLRLRNATDTIPQADLATKNIVSFVKYGHTLYSLVVDTVWWSKKTLFVEYTSTVVTPNMGSTMAQSVIITTSETFEKVHFTENGTVITTIAHPPAN